MAPNEDPAETVELREKNSSNDVSLKATSSVRSQQATVESTFTRAVVELVPSATISFGKIVMLTGVASASVEDDERLVGALVDGPSVEVASGEHAAAAIIAAA